MEVEDNKVSFEEFKSIIWSDYISENVVSTAYMNKNEDFVNELTFEFYDYYRKGSYTIKELGRMIEKFFFTLFRFKGGNENIVIKDRYYGE